MLESLAALHPNDLTRQFWDACARRELRVQRCADCGAFRFPPLSGCRQCGGARCEWVSCSGRGRVFSFTTVAHAVTPELADDVPYGVALVELDDAPGVRLVTNLLGVDPAQIEVGMEVELAWDEPRPGVVLPRFRPVGGSART